MEAVHHVELLVIVLILLGAAIGALTEEIAVGEIMVHLHYRPRAAHHHSVVALMILQVIMIYGRRSTEGDVATIYQYLLQGIVLVYHIAAIVYRLVRTAISHMELFTSRIILVGNCTAR
jgi:hypothetical protein